MHERSLVQTLIRQIDDELRMRGLRHLQEVHLQIGEFAGVEPTLLVSAFAELTAEHWPDPVELRWEIIPLTVRCRRCAGEFFVEQFRFVCPRCDYRQVEVTAGEELILVSLRAETASPPTGVLP